MKSGVFEVVGVGLVVGLMLFSKPRNQTPKTATPGQLDENGDPYMRMWMEGVGAPVGGYAGGLGITTIYGNPYK